jgi:membrane-associated HD superfamily phosphohydrolase
MVSYFYREAATRDPTVDPDNFRYPGPKPQTRETAIAMLADSTEAAVRSSPDHSPERIDELVDEVFAERLSEGQLNESDITLRDLRNLAESYKATLKAVYHPRIEYPAPTEAELLLRRLPFRAEASGEEANRSSN